MASQVTQPPQNHQAVIDRFVEVCQADQRVVAAFLGGSYASGKADAYSDLDFGLIITDAGYSDFFAGRAAFVRSLGEPAFLEDFGSAVTVFFIFPDGTECELAIGREGRFNQIHGGPYRVLLDKTNILAGAVFPWFGPAPADQIERLRQLIFWFWHDLSHFITAMARGQLWWAYGQLGDLRRYCVNLARLQANFAAEAEGYEKVEHAIPAAQLAPLQATCCPLEEAAMLRAALVIVGFYHELAPKLAQTQGIAYPADLERVMGSRLKQLCDARWGCGGEGGI